jgi:hypothetical protein
LLQNHAIEIEKEGTSVVMTMLTCGCWYLFFQTATIEIIEVGQTHGNYIAVPIHSRNLSALQLDRISKLYMEGNVIVGEGEAYRRGSRTARAHPRPHTTASALGAAVTYDAKGFGPACLRARGSKFKLDFPTGSC